MKPADHLSLYATRRNRLAALMGEGVAVIATAPEKLRNRDSHYPYRFDSYFYYLTGFIEPEAALVLVGGKSLLFCRKRDVEREVPPGLARSWRRLRVRQVAGLYATIHARLRKTVQLGIRRAERRVVRE